MSFAHERFLDSSQARSATAAKLAPLVLKQLRLLTLRFAKYCYPKMRSIFLRRSRKYQISKIAQDISFLSANFRGLPKIADRNLFSGDFVIPSLRSGQRLSAAKDLQPFHQTGFSIRDSSGH